jgi:hypothetical protein
MAFRSAVMLAALGLAACVAREPAADEDEVICDGDHFAIDTAAEQALDDCTIITGNLTMTGNALFAVELPALTRVAGSLIISRNPVLTRVHMPKLTRVGGSLGVDNNDLLSSLELPALVRVNADNGSDAIFDLTIRENPQLPHCDADEIRARVLDHGFDGSAEIAGNHGACSE